MGSSTPIGLSAPSRSALAPATSTDRAVTTVLSSSPLHIVLYSNDVFVDVGDSNRVRTTRDETYAINGQVSSHKGEMVCSTGGAHLSGSGLRFTSCGETITQVMTIKGRKGLIVANTCGNLEGDSGGPFYKAHKAYGILDEVAPGSCLIAYEPIGTALHGLGMGLR